MRRTVGLWVAIGLAAACRNGTRHEPPGPAPAPAPARPDRQLANLHAFAKLYGVVRWFHPSDEAAAIDWDRYAVLGVREVRGAADPAALERALAAWVAPIGPSVQILGLGEAAAPRAVDAAAPQVAWQYQGPGFDGGQAEAYLARRTNRVGEVRAAASFGAMVQSIDAKPLRGHKMRLHAQLKAGPRTQVAAWLRVDRADRAQGFFDNMADRMVTAPTWTAVAIEGEVAPDAERVVFGGLALGADGWFDGFALEVDDGHGGWAPLAIESPDFTDGTKGWWVSAESGYQLTSVDAAGHLLAGTKTLTADLFAERPAPDDVTEVDLGGGLRAIVPLSLASKDDHTVPAGDAAAAQARLDALGPIAAADGDVRIADVVVAWNVLAHFYPYHDVIATKWPDALDGQLADAIAEPAPGDHFATLAHLIATIEDGHGGVTPDPRIGLPLDLALVEGAIVVMASGTPDVLHGDVVLAVDGVPAAQALDAARALASGSPQWRTHVALTRLGAGPAGKVTLRLERAGQPRDATVTRGDEAPPLDTYPPVGEARPGVWLVDLSRATMDGIDAKLAEIAKARGVVFDMRGYPNATSDVLSHLLPAPEHDKWMHVPNLIRPGGAAVSYRSEGWDLSPGKPRIAGKVVWITGPGAISYAESVMGYVEAMHLPIVGAATAGTNGDVRTVTLPSGASIRFTGLKVTRHDGARSHLEGIRPTVPVEPTLAGVRAGRDEVLERALALIP